MRTKIIAFVVICLLLGSGVSIWHSGSVEAPRKTGSANQSTTVKKTTVDSASFNKKQYSLTDPTSIWVVVNKQHPLTPKDYAPSDLVYPSVSLRVPGNESMQVRQVMAPAVEAMFKAADAAGVPLTLASGYRSYTYQVGLYNGYVQTQGQATADTQSARPGFSEHQTGLAFDVEPVDRSCELEICFGDTPAGKWVAAHAYEYGFMIRYLPGKESVTGYQQEPWHLRYVGTELATELHRTNVTTLEEFFGVTGGRTYVN